MGIKEVKNSKIARWLDLNGIVLYPFIFFADQDPLQSVVRHEYKHVEQIQTHGILKFYLSYLYYYLRNRLNGFDHFSAYWFIPWEIEARSAEDDEPA